MSFDGDVLTFRRGEGVLTARHGPRGAGLEPLRLLTPHGPGYLVIRPNEIPMGSTVCLYSSMVDGREVVEVVLVEGTLEVPYTPTPAPPSDGDGQAFFELDPASGAPGDHITVTSATFPVDDRLWLMVIYGPDISVELDPTQAEVGPDGRLTVGFVVPAVPLGQHTFLQYSANTSVNAERPFTVTN